MKPIEINKEDVELWFEEQCYEDRAEQTLDQYISMLRHFQKEFIEGKREVSGIMELMSSYMDGTIGSRMYLHLFPLIKDLNLGYTIVHKKDES